VAERLRQLRDQGLDPARKYWHSTVGFNYRMTNMQAALGVAKLERVDELLQGRADVAAWYDEEFADLDGVLVRPRRDAAVGHVYWMYAIILGREVTTGRDELMAGMAQDGIETRPAFPPVHLMPPYHSPGRHFPVAERIGARGIALPTHSRLTRDDVAYVAAHLRAHLQV
jgi:perosamine synthetase